MGLSLTEKRGDEHSTRSPVKSNECDGPLAQVGEAMGFKAVCCEVAELESRWVTRASLNRTGEEGEDAVAQQLELSSFSRSEAREG